MKIIPSRPATQSFQSFPDLEQAARDYRPAGAPVAPASFAREGISAWTLAKLLGDGPAPRPDSLDAVVMLADRRG